MEAHDRSRPASVPPRYLRVVDAVGYAGVTRTRLFGLLRGGQVRSVKVGRQRLVDRASLDAFLDGLGGERAA